MNDSVFKNRLAMFVRSSWEFLSSPAAILFLTYSHKVKPAYGMTWWRRIGLGLRFWRNYRRVQSGTSWRAHLVMAMKLLELPPGRKGDVVECGCWKGGATVNLSIICAITGRKLKVYDSFEGLPPPVPGDVIASRIARPSGSSVSTAAGSSSTAPPAVRYSNANTRVIAAPVAWPTTRS